MTDQSAILTDNYLTHRRGILSWLFTLDHKRIAVMYMVAILASFLIGGLFALMLRSMLIRPHPPTEQGFYDLYNHMFTLHGAVMVFMFMIPAIPAILGNFALPMMLGARDVAFPRLNLLSFHLYSIGACSSCMCSSAACSSRPSAFICPAASASILAGPSTRPTALPSP